MRWWGMGATKTHACGIYDCKIVTAYIRIDRTQWVPVGRIGTHCKQFEQFRLAYDGTDPEGKFRRYEQAMKKAGLPLTAEEAKAQQEKQQEKVRKEWEEMVKKHPDLYGDAAKPKAKRPAHIWRR